MGSYNKGNNIETQLIYDKQRFNDHVVQVKEHIERVQNKCRVGEYLQALRNLALRRHLEHIDRFGFFSQIRKL